MHFSATIPSPYVISIYYSFTYHDAACIVGFDTNLYLNERGSKGKNGILAAFSFATLLIGPVQSVPTAEFEFYLFFTISTYSVKSPG